MTLPPPLSLSDAALEWVMRLNSGSAGPAEQEGFRRWRLSSPAHEAAAREAETLWNQMGDLQFDSRAGLVRPGAAPSRPGRRTVLLGLAGLAAGGGFWASGGVMRLRADYTTAVAQPQRLGLPDGSAVHLNARSALDLHYGAEWRELRLLEGQAWFEVAPDRRPFRVLADGVRITALGTAFDVARDLPGGRVEIAVTRHAVQVEVGGTARTLHEGESLQVTRGRIGTAAPRAPEVTAAWREGLYIAEDRPLREIIAALSAWHPGRILLQGSRIGDLRVNAVLDLRSPVTSLLALQEGLPLRVRNVTRYLTVISAA